MEKVPLRMSTFGTWKITFMRKTKAMKRRKNRRVSTDSSSPIVTEGMETMASQSLDKRNGAWGDPLLSEGDDEEQVDRSQNKHEEGFSHLDTKRHKFSKEVAKFSCQERRKFMAYDETTKMNVMLHQVTEDKHRSSSGSIKRESAPIPGSHGTDEMTMALFREVLLLRCTRKCPYILTCHGFALDAVSHLYISTEFFDGETLREAMQRNPTETLPEMKSISRQLLKALNFLDCNKIVHNDVTASNVLVRHNQVIPDGCDERCQVKLINFRSARDLGTTALRNDDYFCSDCHAIERPSTTEDDMQAFGHLLFSCLVGCKPWATSCDCDKDYARFRQAVLSLNRGRTNVATTSMRGKKRTNEEHMTSPRHSLKRSSTMTRFWAYKRSFPESSSHASRRKWKTLSKKMANCIALLLSPAASDRPMASELLTGSQFSSLFTTAEISAPWTKNSISSLLDI